MKKTSGSFTKEPDVYASVSLDYLSPALLTLPTPLMRLLTDGLP